MALKSLAHMTFGAMLLVSGNAIAAQRTMISDYTGLACAVNSNGAFMRAQPNEKSPKLKMLADGTQLHILGGRQFGKFVAFPNSDAEFARTWLKVRQLDSKGKMTGVTRWVQSGSVNCGG